MRIKNRTINDALEFTKMYGVVFDSLVDSGISQEGDKIKNATVVVCKNLIKQSEEFYKLEL